MSEVDVLSVKGVSAIAASTGSEKATKIMSEAQILNMQKGNIMTSASNPTAIAAENLARENAWLKEKLKEITADRDRLLCEVANLQLELDMAQLKRLPEER